MPHQYWRFSCCGTFDAGRAFCGSCGAKGRYLGWRRTAREQQAAFFRVTGVPPYGEGRMSAEGQAVAARRVTCTMCDGHGILDHPFDNDSWAYCPVCKGNGAALDGFFFAEFVRGPGEAVHPWIKGRRADETSIENGAGGDPTARLPSLHAAPIPEVLRRLPPRHEQRPTGTKAMGDGPQASRILRGYRPGAWLRSPITGWVWAKWPNGVVGWVHHDVELPPELEVFPFERHPRPGE